MTEITIELDDAREVMYDELAEMFNSDEINKTLEEQLVKHLTQMYDNREQLKQVEEQNGDL
jgi:hypothetical protein